MRDAPGHVLAVEAPIEPDARGVIEDVAMEGSAGDRAKASQIGEVRHVGDVDGGCAAGQVDGHSLPFKVR